MLPLLSVAMLCGMLNLTSQLVGVAACSHICQMNVGVRELKNNFSRYIRRVEQGERIGVTAHDRVIAELVPPGMHTRDETLAQLPFRYVETSALLAAILEHDDEARDALSGVEGTSYVPCDTAMLSVSTRRYWSGLARPSPSSQFEPWRPCTWRRWSISTFPPTS